MISIFLFIYLLSIILFFGFATFIVSTIHELDDINLNNLDNKKD